MRRTAARMLIYRGVCVMAQAAGHTGRRSALLSAPAVAFACHSPTTRRTSTTSEMSHAGGAICGGRGQEARKPREHTWVDLPWR